jgi:hypothetical protein
VAANYVSVCAQAEHFLDFRQIVRANIEAQLAAYLEAKQSITRAETALLVASVS